MSPRSIPVSIAILALTALTTPAFAKTCDIAAYGANPDDTVLDDQAIEKAIEDCAKVGGTVHVPKGVFLTGGTLLQSNISLHLAGGAVLRGAPDLASYRTLPTGEGGRSRGVLAGVNVSNVTIYGSGTIDGAGTPFHAKPNDRPDFTLGLFNCNAVRIRDVTIIDPARYHVTLNQCRDLVLDGVTILADMLAPNSDGIQVRNSQDVRISNCRIETGDDAIVLKSTGSPVARISITNCALKSDDAAIKFGTGSNPGISHVNVSNVTITGSRYGIALFMQDGGDYHDNRFSDILIETGGRHAREYPIFVDIDTRQPDDPHGWGHIKGLTFDGIDITTRGNILIQGQPGHDVEGLSLSNINMQVTNAVDVTKVFGKPRGNKAHAPRTGAADHSNQDGHIVIGHGQAIGLSNVVTRGTTPGDQRKPLLVIDVKGLTGNLPPNGAPQ